MPSTEAERTTIVGVRARPSEPDQRPSDTEVIDLRHLHRAAEFAATLAATDLRWPDLAHEIASQVARIVGDAAAVYLPCGPGEPLTLQAADHRRPAEAQPTWVDLLALTDPLTEVLHDFDLSDPVPQLLHLGDSPVLRAGQRGSWPLPHRVDANPPVIVAPLVVGREPLGALVVARDQSSPQFDPDDLDFVADLASRAAVAIHDSRLVRGALADARAASEAEAISGAILRSAIDAVIVIDDAGRISSLNPAAESLSGYSADELVGRRVDVLIPARDGDPRDGLAGHLTNQPSNIVGRRREIDLRRRDGTEEPVEISMSEVQVGERRLFVGIARDVAQRRHEEQELRNAAQADTLTGLVNRASFHRALVQRIERIGDGCFALLFLDLDGFKAINDSFGHPSGDHVLQDVAARLTDAVRRHDLVARYGGDEFVVVVESDNNARIDAEAVANRIRLSFGTPFMAGGVAQPLDISIGIALYPDDGRTISALITHADRAMYEEKRSKPAIDIRPNGRADH